MNHPEFHNVISLPPMCNITVPDIVLFIMYIRVHGIGIKNGCCTVNHIPSSTVMAYAVPWVLCDA